jgi:uncharacterized protein DUF4276
MPRLLIHVEGQTEESFVNEVLRERLYAFGYERVGARLLGNARQRERRGGVRAWDSVKRDIIGHLKGDSGCIATTMVDYYGLPQVGAKAWPGRAQATTLSVADKGRHVAAELLNDVVRDMGNSFDQRRFLPFVVVHEFEGLLFSDCVAFARAIGRESLASSLQTIRDQFATPEHINDAPATAPSKRVEAMIPGYDKPLFGTLAALQVGVDSIIATCTHFRTWLADLKMLAALDI